jgi:Uma2 family endonuclease
MTYAELLKVSPLDNLWHELIDGVHIARGGAWVQHQQVLGNVAMQVWQFLEEHPIGEALHRPFDVVLDEQNVLHPDLFYVTNARRDVIRSENAQGAPDLIVEVLDDESRRRDELDKRVVYERFGVGEYWLVDPEARSVKVYRRAESGAFAHPVLVTAAEDRTLTTSLLPGLTIDLAEVFEE